MCGICGVLKLRGPDFGPEIEPVLKAMGDRMIHRGPDDEQLFIDGPVSMLFRRLSIIDLDGGSQPMMNEDGSIILMVNGEIYNHLDLRLELKDSHVFKTRSDSEVILHLYEEYGIDFLQKLNGMFAIMLWDKNKRRMIIARDRLGIKPIYYNINEDRIIFASEIKALLAYPDCPREYDWESALSYRRFYASSGDLHSFFKGINYLSGGSALIYEADSKRPQVKKWWKLEQPSKEDFAGDTRTEQEIIREYREILEDSVKIRLMADVEAGIFLSGGIDSVAIASLSSRYQKLHTFSHLNISTLQNGDGKSSYLSSRDLSIRNHQVACGISDGEMITPEDWKQLVWLTETNYCFAEQLFKFQLHKYAKETRPNLKVILLGQGSDEFNGGYFTEIIKQAKMEVRKDAPWIDFVIALKAMEKWSLGLQGNAAVAEHGEFVNRDYLAGLDKLPVYENPWFYHFSRYIGSLQHYNLWHEDRTAAGNSIENRVPFLDHRLVEFCMKIPPSKYAFLFREKRILKEAMKGLVPEYVRTRQKQPFYLGEYDDQIFRMMFKILVADKKALFSEAFGNGKHPVLDRTALDVAVMRMGKQGNGYRGVEHLFRLVNMGLLEKMAKTGGCTIDSKTLGTALQSVEIRDWEKEEDDLAKMLSDPDKKNDSKEESLPGSSAPQ